MFLNFFMAKSKQVTEQEEVKSKDTQEVVGDLTTADQVKEQLEKEKPVGHPSRDFGKK